MANEPVKEQAKHAGVCHQCGLMFFLGDWIMVYHVDGIGTVAAHAEHYGGAEK